jgi:hypothetical protein
MLNTWDTMICIASAEDKLVKIKKLLCDGSFLKGHTAKEASNVSQQDAGEALRLLEAAKHNLEAAIQRHKEFIRG